MLHFGQCLLPPPMGLPHASQGRLKSSLCIEVDSGLRLENKKQAKKRASRPVESVVKMFNHSRLAVAVLVSRGARVQWSAVGTLKPQVSQIH
jgi:hypothetical protein